MVRKTKIICTIGPACNGVEIMREMMISGMNIARINLYHSENQDFVPDIEQIIRIREEQDIPVAIIQDTNLMRIMDVK